MADRKNGRTLFDRPKPTVGCSANGRIGRDEKKEKTQETMERESRKRSSSVGSEKMERVGGR